MKLQEFKEKAEDLLGQLETLIHKLPQKGNTSDECQRVTLQIAINEVQYAINGTTEADLKEATHECTSCGWEGTEDEMGTVTDLSQREIGYDKCCPECRCEEVEEL